MGTGDEADSERGGGREGGRGRGGTEGERTVGEFMSILVFGGPH